MRFCSLKFQNLVRKIDLVNRRWVFNSRAYSKMFYRFKPIKAHQFMGKYTIFQILLKYYMGKMFCKNGSYKGVIKREAVYKCTKG